MSRVPRRLPRLGLFSWLGVGATLAAAAVLYGGADRWWPVLPYLYGPRWILFVLPLATVPWVLQRPRRGILPATLAWSVFAFAIVGVRIGTGRWSTVRGIPLKVIEFNIGGNAGDITAITLWLRAQDASVIVLIECLADRGERVAEGLRMHAVTGSSMCVLSPFPIEDWKTRDQREFWKERGSGAIGLATIRHPRAGTLRIGSVHLATPRDALDTFSDLSELLSRGAVVERNRALREAESAAAREWLGDPANLTLIAGDFNLPVESAIYRRYWSDFTNAFSRAGIGVGNTKYTRLFGTRIDHLLLGAGTDARQVRIGPPLGSDHRPMIADLVVSNRAQRTTVAR